MPATGVNFKRYDQENLVVSITYSTWIRDDTLNHLKSVLKIIPSKVKFPLWEEVLITKRNDQPSFNLIVDGQRAIKTDHRQHFSPRSNMSPREVVCDGALPLVSHSPERYSMASKASCHGRSCWPWTNFRSNMSPKKASLSSTKNSKTTRKGHSSYA